MWARLIVQFSMEVIFFHIDLSILYTQCYPLSMKYTYSKLATLFYRSDKAMVSPTWKTRLGEARTKLASTSANFFRLFSVAFEKVMVALFSWLRRVFKVPLTSSSFSIRRIWSLKDDAWVRKDTKLAGWDSRGSELGSSTIKAWKNIKDRLVIRRVKLHQNS